MKYCRKCGKPAADDRQRFCIYCGTEFPQVGPVANNVAGQAPSAPQQGFNGNGAGQGPNGSNNRKKGIIIAIVIILVVLCVLAGAIVFFLKREKTIESDSEQGQETVVSSQVSEDAEPTFTAPPPTEAPVAQSEAESAADTAVNPNLRAEASDKLVVFRNVPKDSVMTVDGQTVSYDWVNGDAVIPRDNLPDVCIVRVITPSENNKYMTAAAWYNYRYGNELTMGDASDYGAYQECDSEGKGEPSYKEIDVLTWAYYTGFLKCINDQTTDYLVYSGSNNFEDAREHIFSKQNSASEYDLSNYQAVCSAPTIRYQDGKVCYNASFVCYAKDRGTGKKTTISNHRTIELCWQNGMWVVNRIAFLSDDDFNAGRYADLP